MLTRRKVFEKKIKELNKNYDKWFFVVTDKNKVSNYREFGKVIDLRYLKEKIDGAVGI